MALKDAANLSSLATNQTKRLNAYHFRLTDYLVGLCEISRPIERQLSAKS